MRAEGQGMALYDRILGFVWLFIGFGLCAMSYHIGLGQPGTPGSGFIPFLTGCLLLLLSLVNLFKIFLSPKNSEQKRGFWEDERWGKQVSVVGALFGYILLLPIFGYIIVTCLFLISLGRLIQPQRWRTLLFISALSGVISYLVFGVWLQCQFPRGYFWF